MPGLKTLGITIGVLTVLLPIRVWLFSLVLGSVLGVCCFAYLVATRPPPLLRSSNLAVSFPRFAFTLPSAWPNEVRKWNNANSDSEPAITPAVESIISSVVASFISPWHSRISPDKAFPLEIKRQLRFTVKSLAQRLDEIDLSEFIVIKILPLITEHFVNFQRAEEVVTNKKNVILNRTLTSTVDLDYVIASNYNRGKLHPVIRLKKPDYDSSRKEYIAAKIAKILPCLFASDEIASPPVAVLLRELLTCCVLHPCLSMVSESDFWNQIIVSSAGKVVRDQDQVKQFMTVLDKHSQGPLTLKRLTLASDDSAFRQILKEIRHCKSVFGLKQYRYYLSVEINKSVRELETSNGNPEQWKTYSKRLQMLKQETNNAIAQLNSEDVEDEVNFNPDTIPRNYAEARVDLLHILNSSSSLSYFMEFMERRNRTVLLQFWLTVNGINDPLDTLMAEDSLQEDDTTHLGQADDIVSIFNQFFSEKLLKIPPEVHDAVAEFVESYSQGGLQPHKFTLARKSVLLLQKDVLKRMNRTDLVAFKQSELFLKLLATEEFTEEPPKRSTEEDNVLKAVEAALNEIMTQKQKVSMTPLASSSGSSPSFSSADLPKSGRLLTPDLQREVFGVDSLTLFSEESDKLFDDSDTENGSDDDDKLSVNSASLAQSQELSVAAPGDLNLSEEIANLSKEIERLEQQELILEPLISKAQLTNNQAELKILKKSKAGLEREIQLKDLQRQQYIVQENDNSLFGMSKVRIQSYISDVESSKEFILYIIEVQRLSTTDPSVVTAGWVIARRFSQFYKLNEYLKSKYQGVKDVPFPSRKVVLKFQQRSLVEERKNQLEQYLQHLIQMPDVCSDRLFRAFLSSKVFSLELNASLKSETKVNYKKNIANKIYSRISVPSLFLLPRNSSGETKDASYDDQMKEMRKELTSFDNDAAVPFVRPICDFLTAAFSFGTSPGNGWLRGRAVLVVLQQLLGTTIEKIVREYIGLLKGKTFLEEALESLKGKLWPDGTNFRKSGAPRSLAEKTQTRQEAKLLLEKVIVGNCSKLFGLTHSKYAASLFVRMLQNEILNVHLVFEIFDELLKELFPEIFD